MGGHLCERLLSEGYRVVCMDNLRSGSVENLSQLHNEVDFEYIDHDVTSRINLPGELDEIYHFASHTRSIQYVDDLIEGVILLMNSSESAPVNIGNPKEYTVLEVARMIIELSGSASEIVREALPEDDPRRRCPEIRRAREVLGWEPHIPASEGLKRTLAWFCERAPQVY